MSRLSPPDVTVVTPSFQQASFIEETIQSVLSQTGVQVEYLVMDGGSTDGTLEILEKYRSRLQYLSEKDQGQTDAINKGFQRAQGRILAYLNSDDTYLPGALAKAVRFLDEHPEFAMVYGEGYHVDAQGRFLGRYYTEPFDFQRLAEVCFICQPTAFVRREVLSTVGYPDVTLHYCMDYDYWIRIGKRYSVGYLPHYLATSRLHPENKTLSRTLPVRGEILRKVHYHYGRVPARWIADYSHAWVERYLSRKDTVRDFAFRLLVHTLYLLKYVQTNKRLPLNDSMKRLYPKNAPEMNDQDLAKLAHLR
jgi:glycosyltransferase involved in cell wall biosynthesis